MKTTKVIGLGVATLAVIVIAATIYLWSSLDSIVEAAIEKYGSQATQTQVKVAAVKLTLIEGTGTIEGITVASPAGFSRKQLFTLENVTVAIDPKTVTDEVVVIDKVLIQAPQVFYEINARGQSNLDALKRDLQQASSGKADTADTNGKQVKLIIRKFIIERGEVDARIAALNGKDLSANLPRIELTDIGKQAGGATPAEVAEKIGRVLIDKTGQAVASLGVEQYLGKSAEEVRAQLEEGAKKAIEDKVGDKLKGLFGQ